MKVYVLYEYGLPIGVYDSQAEIHYMQGLHYSTIASLMNRNGKKRSIELVDIGGGTNMGNVCKYDVFDDEKIIAANIEPSEAAKIIGVNNSYVTQAAVK